MSKHVGCGHVATWVTAVPVLACASLALLRSCLRRRRLPPAHGAPRMAEEANPRAQARLAAVPTWAQRAEALTHILTHPSHSPSLHSQLFVASRVPCPPSGPGSTTPYPPFLCPGASLLRWALASVFLPRAARLCLPPSSWRSRCPFQLPPPLVPSVGIEPAPERWGDAELAAYARRRRARRGPLTARPPVSVAGVVFVTVPCVVITVAAIRELFWVRPNRV
ncbi:hypothetical protein HU200_027614 [Digitaria exilis]|uniref:Uncharacterized protein n=1 Tax=Digitaria exilis TaxID=1010633 RepID=A0A835ETM3_9POAL|nr:hypothetical protein HU200_027614 [Digitaria exilis]